MQSAPGKAVWRQGPCRSGKRPLKRIAGLLVSEALERQVDAVGRRFGLESYPMGKAISGKARRGGLSGIAEKVDTGFRLKKSRGTDPFAVPCTADELSDFSDTAILKVCSGAGLRNGPISTSSTRSFAKTEQKLDKRRWLF